MFNGNHSKMNYTDSVRDLMIYVQNTLKQMTGAGPAAKMLEELHPGRPPPTPVPAVLCPACRGKRPEGRIVACELSVWPGLPGALGCQAPEKGGGAARAGVTCLNSKAPAWA